MIINSLSRQTVGSFRKQLFDIFFEIINNKRISKEFEKDNLSFKQEMWLSTLEKEYINEKIDESATQEEYHRLLIVLNLKKTKENLDVKELCEKLMGKENLSMVYRVQAEHMLKEDVM